MKKNILQLCSLSFFVLTTSCMKMDMPDKKVLQETQSITVELLKNETYHYTLPQNQSDDAYQVTRQASHFSVSELGANEIYTYKPALNYVGTDDVTIANVEEQHNNQGQCGNQQVHQNNNGCGNNHHDSEIERTINIHFIIKEKQQGKLFKAVTICPVF
jgi:hypothetical protein